MGLKGKRVGVIIAVSTAISLAMLLVCNLLWDSQYTYGFGDDSVFLSSVLLRKHCTADNNGDIVPINTAYDQTLVPMEDEFGIPVGTIGITDREKLLHLFQALDKERSYDYIFCDIFFDGRFSTPADSALFALLGSMPRLVIPRTGDGPVPYGLEEKAAISDYTIFKNGDQFLKYKYLRKGGRSVPLKMYHDLCGKDIKRCWPFYCSDGRPCNNSVILPYDCLLDATYSTDGKQQLFYLGTDICSTEMPADMFKGKIVLVGDFTETDIHDTPAGPMPGIMITYNAYLTLKNGDHKVPLCIYFVLFVLFFVYSVIILARLSFKPRKQWLAFCLDWVSFTFPLSILCWLSYYFAGIFINAVFIGTIFSIFSAHLQSSV